MKNHENEIVSELNNAQGNAMDIGGYYFPTDALAFDAMRPSGILNDIINNIA